MQKFVDLQSLGTKLQIISAFSIDHIKGFIYIEADKQADVNEVFYILGADGLVINSTNTFALMIHMFDFTLRRVKDFLVYILREWLQFPIMKFHICSLPASSIMKFLWAHGPM